MVVMEPMRRVKGILAPSLAIEASDDGAFQGPSFETFFGQHHGDLFAAMLLITRDRHEADEIGQEAFLRVLERWDRIAAMDDPEGYLYRTAMNVFRSRRRRAALALRRMAQPNRSTDVIAAVERREMLAQALAALTPRERAAVVLTDVLGYSSEEAGSWLHIKPVTVRVLASRGRARMQKEMSDDDTG
jgi:RNA polymerase sigma-70 factor, ECF subfamily